MTRKNPGEGMARATWRSEAGKMSSALKTLVEPELELELGAGARSGRLGLFHRRLVRLFFVATLVVVIQR